MEILKKIIITIVPVFFSGCTENFIPQLDEPPVLCINSLITAGQPVDITVSRTWMDIDYSPDADYRVNDAEVALFVNGEQKLSDYLPAAGDRIHIEADSRTYGHAEADVTVPESVGIKVVNVKPTVTKIKKKVISETDGVSIDISFSLMIELEVKDDPRVDNYFNLDLKSVPECNNDYPFLPAPEDGETTIVFNSGSLEYDVEPIFSEHLGVFESVVDSDVYGYYFFSDRQFSGATYTLHLYYPKCNFYLTAPQIESDLFECGFEVKFNTISLSYYNWLNYLWLTNESFQSVIIDAGLGNSIWGYSNVSTGAGVVAAQNCFPITISLKDFLLSTVNL